MKYTSDRPSARSSARSTKQVSPRPSPGKMPPLLRLPLFLILLLFTGWGAAAQDSEVTRMLRNLRFELPKESMEASNFTLEDIDGESHSLEDYRGKVVFLNFWATWCPPCRAEMPSMERLYQDMEGQNFMMLAVNLQEDRKKVADFVQTEGYSFPVLLDQTGMVGGREYGVQAIPTTYLIDADGTILGRVSGTREWDTPQMASLLQELTGTAE